VLQVLSLGRFLQGAVATAFCARSCQAPGALEAVARSAVVGCFVTFFVLNETLCSVRVGAVSFPFASMITNIQARVGFVNKSGCDKYLISWIYKA